MPLPLIYYRTYRNFKSIDIILRECYRQRRSNPLVLHNPVLLHNQQQPQAETRPESFKVIKIVGCTAGL